MLASIAPYTAKLIVEVGRHVAAADGLALVGVAGPPKIRKNAGGMTRVKTMVRRLRSSRRTSSRRKVSEKPPSGGTRRSKVVDGGGHRVAPVVSGPVRARKASSSPRAVISRSRAGVVVSRWRATASESAGAHAARCRRALDGLHPGHAVAARGLGGPMPSRWR